MDFESIASTIPPPGLSVRTPAESLGCAKVLKKGDLSNICRIFVHMDLFKISLLKYRKIFMVYDRNVESYALKLGNFPSFPVVAGECHKTMETVLDICRWLLEQKADKGALLLAVGGGFTSDVAGFAASIYKRGIRYGNVPTTLLAQVDAAIGGKTGVNLDGYKNMLGVIRQPEFVHISSKPLESLPKEQLADGVAELLKTFIINNRDHYYEKAVNVLNGEYDFEMLEPLIKAAGNIKKKIVRKDPDEKEGRMVLNLGHTYAHAIEWVSKGSISHGQAVAMGIIRAAELSEKKGIAEAGLADRLRDDFASCGLRTEIPYTDGELEAAIEQDKKTTNGKLNFVYIKRIGKVVIKKA